MTVNAQYHASSSHFSVTGTANDIFTINGSNSALIRVVKIGISSTQSTAGINIINLVKRKTVNSGGTAVPVNIVADDSSSNNASAIVTEYKVSPTSGTLVGNLESFTLNSTDGSSTLPAQFIIINFTIGTEDPMILNNANESLSWNLGGITPPTGLRILAFVKWTEQY
jgi:hypothetical protein